MIGLVAYAGPPPRVQFDIHPQIMKYNKTKIALEIDNDNREIHTKGMVFSNDETVIDADNRTAYSGE